MTLRDKIAWAMYGMECKDWGVPASGEYAGGEKQREQYLRKADAILALMDEPEPVAWRVEIECDGGPYIEHWDASRRDRAWAQFQEASEAGDDARMFPLYASPTPTSADEIARLRTHSREERERHGWQVERGVTCVVCPDCAFTFDADHEDDRPEGGYTCPNCSPEEPVGYVGYCELGHRTFTWHEPVVHRCQGMVGVPKICDRKLTWTAVAPIGQPLDPEDTP